MESSHLAASSSSYGAINVPEDEIQSRKAPLLQLIAEVRSGKQQLRWVFVFSLIAAVGACLNGFMLGYTSLLVINTEKFHYPEESEKNLQYIGSIATIGALLAGLVTGLLSDKLGRKLTLLLGIVPYILGFFLIALSFSFIKREFQVVPYQVLYLAFILCGRALSGFASGWMSLVVPVYIVEIAPSSLKGLFGSLNQLAVTFGVLIIYFLNTYLQYYIASLVVMSVAFLFAIGVCFIPESPRWLIANGKDLEANRILYNLRGPRANIAQEMQMLRKVVESQSEYGLVDRLRMFKRISVFVPLLLIVALMFFQQFSGINAVIFYAGSVLQSAGLNPTESSLAADFGVGIIQVIATFVSVILVDILGRKILLSFGGILLALSTGVLGVYFFLQVHYCKDDVDSHIFCHPHFGYLAAVCLAIFIVGFSIGWGPIPWVMMSELAPLQVRGIMSGIAVTVNWSCATVITGGFSKYEKAVHPYGAWWTFCGIAVLSVIFTIFFLPETKGKDLEEIEEFFKNLKLPGRKNRNTLYKLL